MTDTGIVKKPRNNSSKYTEQEIELGLRALAICSGNARRASNELDEQGTHIPYSTLDQWARRYHVERYEEIRKEILPAVKAELAEAHTSLALRQVDVSSLMLDRLKGEYQEIPIRDLPGAIRNVDTGSGIHSQRGMELRGEATSIVEHRASPDELQRKLKRAGVTFVEAEAVEVGDKAEAVVDVPSQHAESHDVTGARPGSSSATSPAQTIGSTPHG